MPAAQAYNPNNKALWAEAEKELLARRTLCNTAWDYYEGRHAKHLKTASGETDDNVVINLWKQGKDREITFLFPKMPGFELDDNLDDDSDDEKWLRGAWAWNKGLKMLRRLARYGALDGHVFAKVMASEKPDGYPRIVALNPANTLAFWKADDYDERLFYATYYEVGGKEQRQDVVKLDDGNWWFINWEREKKRESSGQEAPVWRETGRVKWAFELCPIVDWQHIDMPGRFYGDNEASLIPLNDKVNKIASDTSRILRFYSQPQTVILADIEPEKVKERAIGNAWVMPRDADVKNVEMQSDLQSSVRFTEMLVEAMKSQQRVVVLSGDVADLQRVTNLGVETVFIDQIAKTDELWEQYEPGIADLCKLLLCVGRKTFDVQVKVNRASPLPKDAKETIEVQEKELDLGLASKDTIMRERGRNPKKERELIDNEDTGNDNALIRAMGREAMIPNALTPNPSPARRGETAAPAGGQ